MIRKALKVLILAPLAILLVALAVANRQAVTVSLDPFDRLDPALAVTVPLYVLILLMVVAGVVIGGVAAWLRQGRWRGRAKSAEARTRELGAENERLRGREAVGPALVSRGSSLRLPPAG